MKTVGEFFNNYFQSKLKGQSLKIIEFWKEYKELKNLAPGPEFQVKNQNNQQTVEYSKVKTDPFYRYLPENFKVALNFVFKYQLEMFGYDFYQ